MKKLDNILHYFHIALCVTIIIISIESVICLKIATEHFEKSTILSKRGNLEDSKIEFDKGVRLINSIFFL